MMVWVGRCVFTVWVGGSMGPHMTVIDSKLFTKQSLSASPASPSNTRMKTPYVLELERGGGYLHHVELRRLELLVHKAVWEGWVWVEYADVRGSIGRVCVCMCVCAHAGHPCSV